MKKGREEKTKFSKILPNNQIITACRMELQVQEMTMNEKLTMIALISNRLKIERYAVSPWDTNPWSNFSDPH